MADCLVVPNPTAPVIIKVRTTVYSIEPPVTIPTIWAYPTGKANSQPRS